MRKTGAEHLQATASEAGRKGADAQREKKERLRTTIAGTTLRKVTRKATAEAYGISEKQLRRLGGRDAVNAMPHTGRELLLGMSKRTSLIPPHCADVPLELALPEEIEVPR